MIHVYTGEGAGKTITALGLALRAMGHGRKVVMIQFMKGRRDTGEYKIAKRLAPGFEVYQFGREDFVDMEEPMEEDFSLANKGFSLAKEMLKKRPDLLILDEVNLAVSIGLINLDEFLDFLDSIPEDMTVVLTGRRAPKEFIEKADLATEMIYIKHPFDRGVESREGLDY
ncbi:MAG: cob(I)yrinic acid a,c-diamide adenosyltransferase [Candidatus Altiarchaeota archaeon]|nr:cob(I)yrinic acid a,c-diamide adenosyltransferase [Candidatus Altiarchaeota archaeon]